MPTPQEIITNVQTQLATATDPIGQAQLYLELGTAYADWAEMSDHQTNLTKAIGYYKQGLELIAPETQSTLWAVLQNSLGTAYRALAEIAAHEANLHHAIVAFDAAVTYGNPSTHPIDFMMALNNLGNTCWQLAQYEDSQRNLYRAETAYQEALKLIQPQDSLLAYASMQNNLGNVYQALAKIDSPATYLHQAITAYSQALKHIKVSHGVMAYASVQNNMGNAYRELSHQSPANTPDAITYLQRAVDAYEDVLEYYTPQNAPAAYIMTRANLGLVYAELHQWDDALQSWHEAAGVAQATGAIHAAQQYRGWINDMNKALAEDNEQLPPEPS